MITFIRLFLTIVLSFFYMAQTKTENIVIYKALDLDVPFILGFSEGKKAVMRSNFFLVTSYMLLTFYAAL